MHFTSAAIKLGDRLMSIWFLLGGRIKKQFTLNGHKYVIAPFVKNRLTLHEKHESWLDSAYQAALESKEGTFVDVGANTGQTMVKILLFDKEREYIGFEPQLDCSFYIDQFIRLNHLGKHSVIPVGLSNQNGMLELLKRDGTADCTASTIKGFRPDDFYTARQLIYVAKGDDIISKRDLKEISIVKIDVEGGELEVIEGLRNTLKEYTPFIFFEILNFYLFVTQRELDPDIVEFREGRNRKLEHILRENDYCIFNILPDDRLIEIAEIRPIVSGDLRITDYVAVHETCKDRFMNNFKGVFE